MKKPSNVLAARLTLLATLCAPAWATISIQSFTPSPAAPQLIGTTITWTAKATDTNTGPLTFQFNVTPPAKALVMQRDFNTGTYSSGTWTSHPFVWTPTGAEGIYIINVVAKDFTSGESASFNFSYHVNPLVTAGKPVVVATSNALVALFSAPACPLGSTMRVQFKRSSGKLATLTPWVPCRAPETQTVEIAGMRPNSTYNLFSQTETNGRLVDGATLTFTTGPLPTSVPFPPFKSIVAPGPQTDVGAPIILHNPQQLGGGVHYPNVATDLTGNVLWYYYPTDSSHSDLLTRPLSNGTFLAIENGPSWIPTSQQAQVLHQIDLAGNIVKETNTGIIQHQLLALGAVDAQPCNSFPTPAPVGSACLGSFHHDFIETLPNGGTAVLADIEKIFPPGTQGDSTGLPVDVVGDMIIVMNSSWQVVWYWDAFEHMDVNRAAVLGETCVVGQGGCPPMFLLSSGISKTAKDWLHANSLYYWPAPQDGSTHGDIIWSSRHQDWVMRIDYKDGGGSGAVLWHMGPDGDFTFNNLNSDRWPWFSHQHDVGIEDGGTGVMTLFDNGDTRVAKPPLGLGASNCHPTDCDSRGMAVTFDESTMQVTPVISQDLGYYSTAIGSAQLLSDGNYFFLPGIVLEGANSTFSYSIELYPNSGTIGGTTVLNLRGPESYRAWQIPNLYSPPTT